METVTTLTKARLDQLDEAAKKFDARSFETMDAAEHAFLAEQLKVIRPGLLEVQYAELKGSQWVPMNFGFDPGAETYEIRIGNFTGDVALIKDYETNFKTVDVKTDSKTMKFFSFGTSYQYSLQEARAAILARMPLQQRKALAARRAMALKMDQIALVGDDTATPTTLKGLFNLENTTTYSTPNGTAGDTEFESKSADEVLLDLNGAADKVVVDTKQVFEPDTMLLPVSTYQYIQRRRVGDGTDRSIMQFFRDNRPTITTIDRSSYLEASGGWGGAYKRGVVYKKDPMVLEMLVSVPFEQLPAQTDLLATKVVCLARTAGVANYEALAVSYFDNI